MPLSRRQIIRACKQRGWTLQPAAFEGLEEYLDEEERNNSAMTDLQSILEIVAEKIGGGRTLTAEVWSQVIEVLDGKDAEVSFKAQRDISDVSSGLEVVGAFQTPRLIYDTLRKQFDVDEKPRSLFGSVEDKTNMLAQRYALARQRVLRHKLFRPNNLHRGRSSTQEKLTPIESLLGKHSGEERLLLLGILVQVQEGKYYLEDPTGQVPVNFQDTSIVDDIFVTEHCVLLVEGAFYDDVLYVHRLGHPLLETRDASHAAICQQISHPAFRTSKLKVRQDDSFVILSDVKVDNPRVLQHLEGLFVSYEHSNKNTMPMFVLMGNFSSSPQGTSDALADLLALIAKFPSLCANAQICIVPGPRDAPAHILPLPPLPKPRNHHKVSNLHMASNPCRLRFAGKEIVVFCHNLLHLFQKQQLLLRSGKNDVAVDSMDTEEDNAQNAGLHEPHCSLVKTILEQGHLVPVAGVPICWNFDHSLRLYPLPDALVLGGEDISTNGFDEVYGDCEVIHPGSMSAQSKYAIYYPNRPKESVADDSDEESMLGDMRSRVEFYRAGDETA